MPTTPSPNILTDPGFLFWAPLGSAVPANTVVGSKFTDAWPVAWLSLGATEDGSDFSYDITVEPIRVAEFFDPIRFVTTSRQGSFAFSLADYTMANYKRALNGAATVVTGATTTLLTTLSPPAVGGEVRAMIGWESLDSTLRLVAYQTISGGTVSSAFKKLPAKAIIPCNFSMEVPAGGVPFNMYAAGAARAGI